MFLGEEENECVKKLVCYVWKNVIHRSKWCANKEHGRKLCVTSSHSWSWWNNFHEQAFGLFIKIVIPVKSIIVFVSNFFKN
jgi:hypothetical protein